ncbi:MAG: 2-amino-4-hydroxy-6-hydroxymethyldihydropteridine diphosphokinase [Pseudomonadota bacterium]
MSAERIFIGIGSNLADPAAQVSEAIGRLDRIESTDLVAASGLYETAPWGIADQPVFVNAVAELRSSLAPAALLNALLTVERDTGRERTVRWGPRVIDLDILAWGSRQIDEPGLTIPHPRLADRDFVLVPWNELAPDFAVPGVGDIATLCAATLREDRPQPRPIETVEACTETRATEND